MTSSSPVRSMSPSYILHFRNTVDRSPLPIPKRTSSVLLRLSKQEPRDPDVTEPEDSKVLVALSSTQVIHYLAQYGESRSVEAQSNVGSRADAAHHIGQVEGQGQAGNMKTLRSAYQARCPFGITSTTGCRMLVARFRAAFVPLFDERNARALYASNEFETQA
ncbi:hypothetical protein BD309DRAFT_984755 [Dichomitus squalens]|nr:hypothetical protein BD309DRAFT_984755 [Dichomitus squalens]